MMSVPVSVTPEPQVEHSVDVEPSTHDEVDSEDSRANNPLPNAPENVLLDSTKEQIEKPETTQEDIVEEEAPKKRRKLKSTRKAWTWDEHMKFLFGVRQFGKGHWKSISRLVGTKSPKQVQSHAQKYFLRQDQQHKNKRSIHDFSLEDLEAMLNSPAYSTQMYPVGTAYYRPEMQPPVPSHFMGVQYPPRPSIQMDSMWMPQHSHGFHTVPVSSAGYPSAHPHEIHTSGHPEMPPLHPPPPPPPPPHPHPHPHHPMMETGPKDARIPPMVMHPYSMPSDGMGMHPSVSSGTVSEHCGHETCQMMQYHGYSGACVYRPTPSIDLQSSSVFRPVPVHHFFHLEAPKPARKPTQ